MSEEYEAFCPTQREWFPLQKFESSYIWRSPTRTLQSTYCETIEEFVLFVRSMGIQVRLKQESEAEDGSKKDLTWGEIIKAIKGHWQAYKTVEGKRKFDHYGMALNVYKDWAIAHHVSSFISTLQSVNEEAHIFTDDEINEISNCLHHVADNSRRELAFYKESEGEDGK